MSTAEYISMADLVAMVKPFELCKFKRDGSFDLDSIEQELETNSYIGWSDEVFNRLKREPINEWLCTDTMVGVYAYYFDAEFVAISFKSARKNDTSFYWTSKESANKVRNFLREIAEQEQGARVLILNMDEAVSKSWLTKQ